MPKGLIVAAVAALFAGACGGTSSPAEPTPSALPAGVLTHVEIPPITAKTASIDIMVIDQSSHLLYVADRTDFGVDVLDVSKPYARYLRTIDLGGTAPNGVILAKDLNKLYTGNNDSTVSVIDLKTFKVIATLKTGGKGRADELDYDPKDHKIYVANSNDGFVTVIDAVSDKILKKFDKVSEGGLEQPRYDSADGMMYLTLSDDNVIAQFDPAKDQLVKKFDVGVPCNPQGLAINPKTNQALLGCGNKKKPMGVLWDLKAGKVVTVFDKTGAGDMTLYDDKADRFFFAASNFTSGGSPGPHLAVFNATAPVAMLATVPTAVGSHSVAYDQTNRVIYVQDQKDFDGGLFAFPLPK
ncbi:MAG TPA: YncE family protein [Candidatus Acidoferrales bacterium]|nr:YncE family protein [Candidatus Acidoferrales bacterium]